MLPRRECTGSDHTTHRHTGAKLDTTTHWHWWSATCYWHHTYQLVDYTPHYDPDGNLQAHDSPVSAGTTVEDEFWMWGDCEPND